ncbi:hypothetical protein KUTeg_020287 [Tegillarca granosa]|uniref:non-specific serine/threonine protein kinase n=1 Tax=Tegillarca granosa TaxID=220873 RepID=A0ABQ9ECS9_TEGGR|nr:hypothetical protein KUTeg_020287 [Tegillarca granosa]
MATPQTDFRVIKTLGEGAFGKVFLVSPRGDTSKQFAMKVIDLTKSTQDERDLAAKEAKLLSDFDHENIIRYAESFEKNGSLCILTEFCDGGDMSEELQKQNGVPLPEPRIYLHKRRILHRDMKTQNIFLTGVEKIAKLGDLGLAKVLERPNAKAVTFCGSPYYMSPEIFACKPYDSKSDIWALGVCVYEMATLERPFDAMLMQQLVFKIVHGQLPPMPKDKYSPALIILMERMLEKNSSLRPSADDIVAEEIFKTTPKPVTRPRPPPPDKRRFNAFETSTAGKSFKEIIQQARGMDDSGEFGKVNDMDMLLQTLSQVYSTRLDKQEGHGLSSILAATHIDNTIKADTYMNKTKDLDKTMKGMKSTKFSKDFLKDSTLTPKKTKQAVDSSEESSDDSFTEKHEQQKANDKKVLNLVVHTLTHIFPKVQDSQDERDPAAMMLYQIEQLQQHCAKVLGMQMFRRAYDMLDVVDDDMVLEEKLIRLMSPEKFAVCGVQLFYCKNFEYNLEKLTTQGTSNA